MNTKQLQLREAFAAEESRTSQTVCFIDQAGSTAMKEHQAEAVWLPSLGWLYDTVTAIATETAPDVVVKYLGDGIMLVYDSDVATKALNAAIRIQEAIKDASEGRNGTKGTIDFNCTVGIATGPVVAFTAPTGSPDFVGTVVDKARRLCDAATPKAILVDRATASAANMTRIECRVGFALGRPSELLQGDLQRAPLKGFDQPVEYYEILWDQQLYGLKSQAVTNSTDRMQSANPQRPVPVGAARQAVAAQRGAREERRTAVVECWLEEKGFGFLEDPRTGEEFFFNKNMLVYPEDVAKVREEGTQVVFTAQDAPGTGKKRSAGGVLVVGEYAEGVLVSLPEGKNYGWLRLHDMLGNRHHLYLQVEASAGYKVGDTLSFRVAVNDKGGYADQAKRPEDDQAA
jgi:class 3 adenylate cyclase